MIKAYGRFVVFLSQEKEPTKGIVLSIGEDVKGISVNDTIFMFDYAPFLLDDDLRYFAVNREHILATEKAKKIV